jgi:hypothetical protein
MRWRVDAEDFGDIKLNARRAIDRAISHVNRISGGGEVHFDARQYDLDQNITHRSGVRLVGKGPSGTVLKLRAGANTTILKTLNYDTLFGTNSTGGVVDFGIIDMTLDGNRDQQSGISDGLSIYGRKYLIENVLVRNAKGQGLFSQWSDAGEPEMEATIRRLRIDTCGRHGLAWEGPHDSYGEDIIIIDASQETDDTWDGLLLNGAGTGRWVNVHVWHRTPGIVNRVKSSARVESNGNELVACAFEGGRRCLFLRGLNNAVVGSTAFANSLDAGPMVVARGQRHRIDMHITASPVDPVPCFQLGEGGGGNSLSNSRLDLLLETTFSAAVDITQDGGRNIGTIKTIGATNAVTGNWHQESKVLVQHPNAVVKHSTPVCDPIYTAGALPSAAGMGTGARAMVTDSNATTFAAIVAGGGANFVPVYSDGTNWRIG